MSDRATTWSITINNPTQEDLNPVLPNNKWKLIGQIEKGENGTVHYQGMLTTPQVRFSAVKKVLPRAHIEVAKNRQALQKYVAKEDTRIATVPDITSNIPTLFDYQHTIAGRWNDEEFDEFVDQYDDDTVARLGIGEIALRYVDTLVEKDIESGMCGIEYIAINPMWRSAWKKFWRSMVNREKQARIKSTVEIYDGLQTGTTQTFCETLQSSPDENGSQKGDEILQDEDWIPEIST